MNNELKKLKLEAVAALNQAQESLCAAHDKLFAFINAADKCDDITDFARDDR